MHFYASAFNDERDANRAREMSEQYASNMVTEAAITALSRPDVPVVPPTRTDIADSRWIAKVRQIDSHHQAHRGAGETWHHHRSRPTEVGKIGPMPKPAIIKPIARVRVAGP
jgi:hypothetical protein